MLGVDIGFQVDRVALRFGYGSTSKRRMLADFRSPLDRKSTARLTIDMPSALTRWARGRQTSAYGRSIQSLRSSDIATAISDSRTSRRSSMINRSQPDMLWIGLGFRREQQSVSHSLHRLTSVRVAQSGLIRSPGWQSHAHPAGCRRPASSGPIGCDANHIDPTDSAKRLHPAEESGTRRAKSCQEEISTPNLIELRLDPVDGSTFKEHMLADFRSLRSTGKAPQNSRSKRHSPEEEVVGLAFFSPLQTVRSCRSAL